MTNCSICFQIRDQLITTEETIEKFDEQINYYQERINYLILANVNRRALQPYYQSLEVVRQIHLLYTELLRALEIVYDRHLNYHNI